MKDTEKLAKDISYYMGKCATTGDISKLRRRMHMARVNYPKAYIKIFGGRKTQGRSH